jgi:very-short-patch-repair endonuclease
VDFFCPGSERIVEIAGVTHTDRIKDRRRQEKLESLGFHFLLFRDTDVKENMDGVLSTTRAWIERQEQHTPYIPSLRGVARRAGVCNPL